MKIRKINLRPFIPHNLTLKNKTTRTHTEFRTAATLRFYACLSLRSYLVKFASHQMLAENISV